MSTSPNLRRSREAQALWAKGEPIKDTLAHRYLKEHRAIERTPPLNLRYLPSLQDFGSDTCVSGKSALGAQAFLV